MDGVGSKEFGIVPTEIHDVWRTVEIHVTARGGSCATCLNQGLTCYFGLRLLDTELSHNIDLNVSQKSSAIKNFPKKKFAKKF